ncbi:thiamine pyrophosphate-requiring protein (plasmid) [Paroceanicella profunda]|uniref:Thiamine pyrophosphate-requiring protein n=1 Tax=Paroceanicella profunda TaxID=2579971 RepID=A0A5B8G667_9RHOB|nr:thiamine pyrophosphate-requiring protein [Paroceanicella profunda]QDL94583.1 thiamine pyrophosphate-requiring protein [Paroceanicella profunda]
MDGSDTSGAAGATLTAGGAIFTRLKALGIDYVFTNSGTDFPPIIEGLAEATAKGIDLPRALVIPHEHAAMGMAHGYYLISGTPQAVMLHTNVGLSNGATGAINAACEHIPMLLMSGRTPVTEQGRFGARTVPIGWGQEMRDQSALVREACKWEYELKFPEQIGGLLDRAQAIASSTPKGPVYLSLPREVLCEPCPSEGLEAPASMAPVALAPEPGALAEAARLLAGAQAPLVIAQRGAGDAASFAAFSAWAQDWGIAVSSWWATHLALPTDHPCHVGADPGPALAAADVIVVLDCLAPWWPDMHHPNPAAKVIHIGPDPLFSRFPVRNFRSDLALAGESAVTLPALFAAMAGLTRDESAIAARRARLAGETAVARARMREAITASATRGITKEFVSQCLGTALEGETSSVFSELGTKLGPLERREHRSWFQEPHSGGLGWSFPCALGAKLAEPGRTCVATMGDGSYMFANPTACHQIAEALELGILVLILNNEEWGAVRGSVVGLYPEGHAAKANEMPLTALKPSPDFCSTARASRAWARRVTEADALPGLLAEALEVTRSGRLALLDIRILPD